MCLQCVHYINRAFSFKQLCERSDATLRQLLATSVDSTFLELKPVCHNEFIVSDIAITQETNNTVNTNEVNNVIQLAKDERLLDESNEIDSFFSK